MGLCMETSSEQDGWWLSQTENKFPCHHEEMSEQVKINLNPWLNSFCFSNLNRSFQPTAVQTMSVELLPGDRSVFSQCTSELSVERLWLLTDYSSIQTHFLHQHWLSLRDIFLSQQQFHNSTYQRLNFFSGETIVDSNRFTLMVKSCLLHPFQSKSDQNWIGATVFTSWRTHHHLELA